MKAWKIHRPDEHGTRRVSSRMTDRLLGHIKKEGPAYAPWKIYGPCMADTCYTVPHCSTLSEAGWYIYRMHYPFGGEREPRGDS